MRSVIIKGLIPIFIFLAFAEGSALGLQLGSMGGFLVLLVINWDFLRKKFFFDWALLISFLVLFGLEGFRGSTLFQYNMEFAYFLFSLLAFLTVLFKRPFVWSYATTKADPIFWNSPFLKIISAKISILWGLVFLVCALSIFLYHQELGSKFLLIKVMPTAVIVMGLFVTIISPDTLFRKITKLKGISSLKNLSEVQSVSFHGLTIGYRTIGEGPAIVLLHGFMMNMHGWDTDFIKRLSQHFRLFLLDYPGVGYSIGDQFEFDALSISSGLREFIARLNLNPVALVGYSMGGFVAQIFAKNHPKLIDSLVLIGTDAGGKAEGDRFDQLSQFAKQFLTKPSLEMLEQGMKLLFPASVIPRIKDRFLNMMKAAGFEGESSQRGIEQEIKFIEHWYQMPEPLDLSAVTLPTLVIFGDEDEVILPENSRALHAKIKQSTTREYSEAGHGLVYQYPIDVAEQIEVFLMEKVLPKRS